MVPRDPHAYRDAHPSRAVLVVEIADTSYRTGREYKFSLYARAGIPECWLVDVVNEAVEVHREAAMSTAARYGSRYRSVETLRPPAAIHPLVAADTSVRVVDVLP